MTFLTATKTLAAGESVKNKRAQQDAQGGLATSALRADFARRLALR